MFVWAVVNCFAGGRTSGNHCNTIDSTATGKAIDSLVRTIFYASGLDTSAERSLHEGILKYLPP